MSRPASAGGAPLQSTSVDTESLAFRRGLISISTWLSRNRTAIEADDTAGALALALIILFEWQTCH